MKILYTTDLHGYTEKFDCIKKITDGSFDAILLGADLLPKGHMASDEKTFHFINRYLTDFFTVFDDIPIILDFGNDDWIMYYDFFKRTVSKFNNVHISHMNTIFINEYKFCGMHCVPDYPFGIKDWCRKDGERITDAIQYGKPYTSENGYIEVIKDLNEFILQCPSIMQELNSLPKPDSKTICLFHSPPFGTGLDKCFRAGPVGSIDIRQWIEYNQPLLTLHGHIHESYELTMTCITKIGDTICINPGQESGTRNYRNFIWCEFDLKDIEATFIRKEMFY